MSRKQDGIDGGPCTMLAAPCALPTGGGPRPRHGALPPLGLAMRARLATRVLRHDRTAIGFGENEVILEAAKLTLTHAAQQRCFGDIRFRLTGVGGGVLAGSLKPCRNMFPQFGSWVQDGKMLRRGARPTSLPLSPAMRRHGGYCSRGQVACRATPCSARIKLTTTLEPKDPSACRRILLPYRFYLVRLPRIPFLALDCRGNPASTHASG